MATTTIEKKEQPPNFEAARFQHGSVKTKRLQTYTQNKPHPTNLHQNMRDPNECVVFRQPSFHLLSL